MAPALVKYSDIFIAKRFCREYGGRFRAINDGPYSGVWQVRGPWREWAMDTGGAIVQAVDLFLARLAQEASVDLDLTVRQRERLALSLASARYSKRLVLMLARPGYLYHCDLDRKLKSAMLTGTRANDLLFPA